MYFLINDIIILAASVCLIYYLRNSNWEKAITVTLVSYVALPVLKIGNKGINSAYVVSAILAIWILKLLLRKQLTINNKIIIYLIASVLSIGIVTISWILQKQYALSHMIHFAGMAQYVIGVFGVSVLYDKVGEKFSFSFFKAIKYTLIWNVGFVILQMFAGKAALGVTKLLYTYPGREAPINTMEEMGRFVRAFGAFYSPTITGVFCLVVGSVLLIKILESKESRRELMAYLFATLFVGLFAFSKTIIIGIFLILGIAAIVILWFQKRIYIRKIVNVCLCVLCSFILVGGLGNLIGLKGQVNYYFGKVFSPFSSLETRYASEEEEGSNTTNDEEEKKKENTGNQIKAVEVFLNNPIIGVGPVAVKGEFVGDSQYMVTLHDGGILNALIYLILYGTLFVYACKEKETSKILVIISIAFGCLSIPVFANGVFIPFVAYLLYDDKKTIKGA